MRLLNLCILLLRVPFILFIFFRAVIVPTSIIIFDNAYAEAVLLSLFHLVILGVHLRRSSSVTLLLATGALSMLTLAGLVDYVFHLNSFIRKYSFTAYWYLTGELLNSNEKNWILDYDVIGFALAALLLFLQAKKALIMEVARHDSGAATKGEPVWFNNILTEDNEGYFENLYGDLHSK